MKCLIAINYVDYKSEHKRKSQDIAMSVLSKVKSPLTRLLSLNFYDENFNLPPSFHFVPLLQNDAQKRIGNNRRMPYIKEIFDVCSNMPEDIFGYMNSDILIQKDFFDLFNKDTEAYVFYKKDIEVNSAEDFLNGNFNVVNEKPFGQDAFFFKKEWWISNRHFFPDNLILGETEFDTCYNAIIQKIAKNYAIKRSLFHINHERVWSIDTRGAVNNKLIWDDIKSKYGIPKYTPEIIHP